MTVNEIKVLNVLVGLNLAKVAKEEKIHPPDLTAALTGRRLDLKVARRKYLNALIRHLEENMFDEEFERSARARRQS